MITISVKDATGNLVFGPEAVDPLTSVGQLMKSALKGMGKSDYVGKLLLGDRPLERLDSLSSAGISDNAELMCVVINFKSEKYTAILAKILEAFKNKTSDMFGSDVEYVTGTSKAFSDAEVASALEDMAKKAGMTALPDEIVHWMHAMLTTGKKLTLCWDEVDFQLCPVEIVGGMDDLVANAHLRGTKANTTGFFSGGLLYLSTFSNNDNLIMIIVDMEGALGRAYGNGGPGAVWHANCWAEELYAAQDHLTAEFWTQAQRGNDNGAIYMKPVCVAPDLTSFFEAFAAVGVPPMHTYSQTKHGWEPNVACQWLAKRHRPSSNSVMGALANAVCQPCARD